MDDEHATPQLSHFNALRRTSSQGPPSLQSLCVEAVTANVAKPGLLDSAQMARLHTELLLEVRVIRANTFCLIYLKILEQAIAHHFLNDDNCPIFLHEQASFLDFTGAGVSISDATLLKSKINL